MEFQFNLNAFIQAIRNITFMLQSEDNKPEGFQKWYESKQSDMKRNELLKRFVAARNIVVKQSSLTHKSKAWSGMYRGRKMKLAIQHEIPVLMDTKAALERAKDFAIGLFLDEEHSAIGEQIGVQRIWVVDELGDQEVVSICLNVFNYMGHLVAEALSLFGSNATHEDINIDMERVQVLLETDVDPSLVDKWGW
ncbi:MAG TPA: hypothetical protein VI423_02905 [Paenisporosarcina sp.]|nr:hypothetical protein [Paenisporosarcina sp.]